MKAKLPFAHCLLTRHPTRANLARLVTGVTIPASLIMLASACGQTSPQDGARDASQSSDAEVVDAYRDDAALVDGSSGDSSSGDATRFDTGGLDGTTPDTTGTDGGTDDEVEWPDEESQPPPPLDPTEPYDVYEATRFLYEGDNAIQSGVLPGTIRAETIAIIRGKVVDRSGDFVVGASVTVLHHPEYGASRTKRDGTYEIAVNGGGPLVVTVTHPAFLPVQRQVAPGWRDWVRNPVVAKGTRQEDARGVRTARVVFEPGLARPRCSSYSRNPPFSNGSSGPPRPMPPSAAAGEQEDERQISSLHPSSPSRHESRVPLRWTGSRSLRFPTSSKLRRGDIAGPRGYERTHGPMVRAHAPANKEAMGTVEDLAILTSGSRWLDECRR
ncbi:MAG: carboxypeptidase regulatory-like domain-containing protein [Deltaproteobacteria bacterium]|nr:carboxypeptidase regulatory-like domain-containing protein [Deltaproteobacteria bacterium]